MLSAIFRFTGKSGPVIAIAGAVLVISLAIVSGMALSQVMPIVYLFLTVGVGLSIMWGFVFVIKAIARY